MHTLAILPIKSFGAAKQRLAGLLGSGSREALAQAMFCDVLAALRRVPGIHAVAVVTASAVAQTAARGDGVHVLGDPAEGGQSSAAAIGVDFAVQHRFDRVLMVPGDTPLLDPREVGEMLVRAERAGTGVVIVPDRHGTGTNALLIAPPRAMAPSFGPDSCERHRRSAEAAGLSHHVEAVGSLMLDVDTPDDLAELSALLEERRQAPLTRGTLRQLERTAAAQRAPVAHAS